MSVRISIIAAMAENRVIGVDNQLPWHIPEDLKRFKTLTMGKPVIMGRKTFESILKALGKPFPGRVSLVVSRSGFSYDGVAIYTSLQEAIAAAKNIAAEKGGNEVFIGGGAQIYEQALSLADRLYLTIVHANYEGNACFPDIDMTNWRLVEEEECHKNGKKEPGPEWVHKVFDRYLRE